MRTSVLALFMAACVDHAGPAVSLYDKGDFAGAARAADEGLKGHPGDDALWGMRIRAALALGNAADLAASYDAYAKTRDSIDKPLVHDLAIATIDQALASPSSVLKIAAIHAIEDAELESFADLVGEKMGDEDEKVAVTAAVALVHGLPQAPHVVADALNASDPEVRYIAIDGIGRKVGKIAKADLEKFADDPDARVRTAAIRGLAKIDDKDAIEILAKRLRDPDDGVRAAAANAIARIGIGNLGDFGKAAVADKALSVRLAGIDLLVAAQKDVRPFVDDADPSFALAAAIASKDHALMEKAFARAAEAKHAEVRAGAMNQASRVYSKEALRDACAKHFGDADLRVQLAAARAVAHAGFADQAASVFAAHLDDVNAAEDLAELGDARGREALAKLVATGSPEDRARAAAAHRQAHVATGGLVAALADASPIVRVAAAAALAILAKE